MSKTFGSLLLAIGVFFAVTVAAIDMPPKDFQEIMKANGEIVDLSAGTQAGDSGNRGAYKKPTSLVGHMRTRDYAGIVQDATTLKANVAKIEAFWTAKNVEDAIGFSKATIKAATDLETAAKAKDDAAIAAASTALVVNCHGCHTAHRVLMFGDGSFRIM